MPPRALSIFADMFFNSAFDEAEIAKEKSIILDEIAAVEDTPDDDVDEQIMGRDVSRASNRQAGSRQ